MNNLEKFFKIAASDDKLKEFICNTNDVLWINVFDEASFNMIIGISQTGNWVIKNARHLYILDDKKKFLYCSNMLEIPYEAIKKRVENRFKKIIEKENIDVVTIFPFFQMIEFALNNLYDDYWFVLAMNWYENLDVTMQCKLEDALEMMAQTKKISQKNRQKARLEVKRLKIRRVSKLVDK